MGINGFATGGDRLNAFPDIHFELAKKLKSEMNLKGAVEVVDTFIN